MIPPELISLGVGTIGGFAMKAFALKMQNDQAKFERMINAIKASDNSMNQAVSRVPNDKSGNWIRRVIVITILFGVVLAPFLLALLGKPIVVEIDTPVKNYLFGLFSTGGKVVFYQLESFLLIPELRISLLSILGFYFGQSAAKSS